MNVVMSEILIIIIKVGILIDQITTKFINEFDLYNFTWIQFSFLFFMTLKIYFNTLSNNVTFDNLL